MADDIGKGDVVEAVMEMAVASMWTGRGPYHIAVGQRAIVAEVVRPCNGVCTDCGRARGRPGGLAGLKLEAFPLRQGVLWCPCEWKKVGPSEAETVAKFAHHLNRAPSRTPARAG